MKKIIKFLVLILLLVFGYVGFTVVYKGYNTHKSAISTKSIQTAVNEYTQSDKYIEYKDISTHFIDAVLVAEDKRFFTRTGFDYISLIRAIINNINAGRAIEGGSTISQQIAKNLYFMETNRGLDEKIAEVFIMNDLEEMYSKEELFALYVSINYYGDGYWGLKQACEGYYKTTANNLTVAQSAMLAGLPNAPSLLQLSTGFDLARDRQQRILDSMLEFEYITEQEYQEAIKKDVHPLSE